MERFTIFRSYHEALRECTPEVRLEVYDAIMGYAFEDREPAFKNPFSKAIWVLILPVLNNSIKQASNGSKPNKIQTGSKTDPNESQTISTQKPNNIQTPSKPDPIIGEGEGIRNMDKGEGNNKDNLLKVDYQRVIELWNSICGNSNGKLRSLADSRKAKVRCRAEEIIRSGQDFLQTIETLFRKISETPFLQGQNQRGWKANFDWVFENDRNYLKVLENRYDQTAPTQPETPAQYGSRHLSERATEESFYSQQSQLATAMLLQDGDRGLADYLQDD